MGFIVDCTIEACKKIESKNTKEFFSYLYQDSLIHIISLRSVYHNAIISNSHTVNQDVGMDIAGILIKALIIKNQWQQ